jgi:kumamolisin
LPHWRGDSDLRQAEMADRQQELAMPALLPFAPSHRSAPPGTWLRPVDPGTEIIVSLYLKPDAPSGKPAGSRQAMATERAAAHEDDFQRIADFAAAHKLTVIAVEPGQRLVRLSGAASAMQAAFGVEIGIYEHQGVQFRGRSGPVNLPADLHDRVAAVLGLDTRPQARAHFVPAAAPAASFAPNRVGQIYNFPTSVTGAGECIGIVELGGGYLEADTAQAFAAMGLAVPKVSAVSVDGGKNAPTPDDGADAEVALDIQVAGGVAPGASIVVYFAPNTDAGFADAINAAVHDTANRPSVISISWGGPESTWTAQAVTAMNTALQDAVSLDISVFVACGDSLATDGVDDGAVHVDFPAASPYAIGCGGTHLTVSGSTVSSEVVWNDGNSGTGGGISDLAAVPGFQSGVRLPANASTAKTGRGVPDVAGNAAPGSGYTIVVNGQQGVVGGTSAVAPLWAGLTALINQSNGKPVGFFLATLYGAHSGVREITSGNNKPTGSALGYDAGAGWNACTGLGVPDGAALTALLAGATS